MPLFGEMQRRFSRTRLQWVALFLALAVLGLLTALDFYAGFRYHREQALADLDGQAKFIKTRVEHQLETIYFALGNLQVAVADADSTLGRAELTQRLVGIRDSLHGVRTLAIFDANGTVTVASRDELVGGNFAHRDYFIGQRAQPDPARLHVSPPFRTVLGVLSVTVSRAVISREGKFLGVVTATIAPEFFADLLKTSRSAEDMQILLSMGDPRAAFAALPATVPAWLGDLVDQGSIAGSTVGEQTPAGTTTPPVFYVRGVRRAVAMHGARTDQMARDVSIRVLVSREMSALEVAGYHDFAFKAGLYGGIVFVSALCLGWFQRRRRQFLQEREAQTRVARDSDRFVRTLADNFPGLLAYWTPDLRCAFANHAHQEWFGRRSEELVGMRIEDMLSEESLALIEPCLQAVLRGEIQRFEHTLTKADGTRHHTWVQYIPDHDGEAVRGFMVLVTDISEVKQGQIALQDAHQKLQAEIARRTIVENNLRARETMFRSLLDNMLNGFVSCRMRYEEGQVQDFVFLEVNPAFHGLTGLHNVVGKSVSEILPGIRNSDPQIFEVFERVAGGGKAERLEIFVAAIDRWISLSVCSPSHGDFFVIFDDISERKRAESELVQLNADLVTRSHEAEAASAAKTRFLSSVSHELRTPLHTILGYSRLLLKDFSGETRRQLEVIERSGAQLLKLIDDLLEFNLDASEVGELQAETVVLHEFVNQLERIGHVLSRPGGNQFSIALAGDLPAAVWVDEQRLQQVLQNLIGNACKYTHNGSISLRFERDDRHEDADGNGGSVATLADGTCRLRFTVDDSGAGIAREDQEHIFEAFNRGASQYGQPGLGLGLAIARQWVRIMGGDIQVVSELGQGSRFWFTLELPIATDWQHAPASTCEAFRDALVRMPRTVLVADDIAENRLLLRDICQRWGFSVVEAADGDAALRRCLAATPRIDAALIDQFMPLADGWEFLRRVRQVSTLAQLPTVLVSASAARKPDNFPPAIDFDLTLLKPIDEQALACFLCRRLRLVEPLPADCQGVDSTGEAPAAVALPADELASFLGMLDLGRVLGIEEWAENLAAKDPACKAFAERVVAYCRAGNLVELEKMAATQRPS